METEALAINFIPVKSKSAVSRQHPVVSFNTVVPLYLNNVPTTIGVSAPISSQFTVPTTLIT